MTRPERQKLKLKYRRQLWLSTGMIGLFFLNLFLVIKIDWMPDRLSALEGTPQLIVLVIMLAVMFIPIAFAFHFNVRSSWSHQALYEERNRMYSEKQRHYVEMFITRLKEEDYEGAKVLHNLFITGSTQTLTRGIMVGLLSQKGDEEDKKLAAKHLEQIPDEVYTPAKN